MQQKTLLYYWLVLYKRKKEIIIITFISLCVALVLSKLLPPVYEAKAIFYVPASSPALTYLSPTSVDRMARDATMPTPKEDVFGPYIGLLKSRKIAEYVHKDFPQKRTEKMLLSDIDFELTDEFLLKIYSRDRDPVLSANIANAYVKYLNILLQEASLSNSSQDKVLLNKQLTTAEENLQNAKNALKDFEEKKNFASLEEEIKNLTNQKIAYQSQLENTRVLIKENAEKMQSLKEQINKESIIVAENDFILSNPSIEHLQKKLSDLAAQIAAARVELKETHPNLKILKSQYEETSARLKQEIQILVASQIKPTNTFFEQLRQNLVTLLVDESRLNATLKGYYEVLSRINDRLLIYPAIKAEWNKLNDNVEHYRKIHEQLRLDFQETEMQHLRDMQFVVLVDSAEPPQKPAFPVWWLNAIVAFICGLLAGIFYAFFIEYIQVTRKIRTKKIIKEILEED
jgi:uncharacterized protein involved in exopolysaccharide biosynthesis